MAGLTPANRFERGFAESDDDPRDPIVRQWVINNDE